MATRNLLTEQTMRILGSGRDPRNDRWMPQEIKLAINEQRNTLAKISFFEALKNDMSMLNEAWLSSYENQQITYNSGRNLWELTLPATPIGLHEGKGISTISWMKDQYNLFIPLKNGSQWMFGESGTMDLQGNQGYFQEGNKLYFPDYISNGVDTVLIKMVANSMDIADDEFFPCPPELFDTIVKNVVSLYANFNNKPVDLSNNNSPN